jgi:glycerol-3-phosphate acyltransferase PlsX
MSNSINKSIALDVMGSDLGPSEVIQGAAIALKNGWIPENVVLVGIEEVVEPLIEQYGLKDNPKVTLFSAAEVIGMHEKPIQSIKSKKDSSLVRAIELVKLGQCAAAVSCGNTGSLMACATLKLRPIEGVSKPALASIWPSRLNQFVVLDVGANPQCRPENLFHYAILGSQYAKDALQIENPRVGLLSIGTEEGKGTDLTDATHAMLKKLKGQINYVGLVEGFQLFNNEVDVVVTDGFTGNVVLKTCESLWKMLKGIVTDEVKKSPISMVGAVLMKGALKNTKARLDPKNFGGAPLLGLRGTVLKAHGSSDKDAISNALRIAGIAVKRDLREHSAKAILKANALLESEPIVSE